MEVGSLAPPHNRLKIAWNLSEPIIRFLLYKKTMQSGEFIADMLSHVTLKALRKNSLNWKESIDLNLKCS